MTRKYLRRNPAKALRLAIEQTVTTKFACELSDAFDSKNTSPEIWWWFVRTFDFNLGAFKGGTYEELTNAIITATNARRLLREGLSPVAPPKPKKTHDLRTSNFRFPADPV